MNKIILFFFFAFSLPCFAQQAEIMTFEQLQNRYMKGESDTLYIINFWATWCAPCVKELPYFENSKNEFKDQPVEIILVSLDFKNQIESRLNPFIKKRDLKSKVIFLDAPGEHLWVPQVSEQWSGAIPATLMINPKNGCRTFYENEFTQSELSNQIYKNLKLCKN
jgi:thiol-disulfide isomerase/thioredoxin